MPSFLQIGPVVQALLLADRKVDMTKLIDFSNTFFKSHLKQFQQSRYSFCTISGLRTWRAGQAQAQLMNFKRATHHTADECTHFNRKLWYKPFQSQPIYYPANLLTSH